MPIYEYQCDDCDKVEEALQKITDKPLSKCRHCSGKLHRIMSQSTFHLKGTGWYVTDYAGKSQNKKNSDSASPNNASSGESKNSESKKQSSDQ